MHGETHWRMWLLGTLSRDLHVDLATLYGVYDDSKSALGTQMRHTVASLMLWDEADTDAATMLDIAHQAANGIVRRFKPPVCEACDS